MFYFVFFFLTFVFSRSWWINGIWATSRSDENFDETKENPIFFDWWYWQWHCIGLFVMTSLAIIDGINMSYTHIEFCYKNKILWASIFTFHKCLIYVWGIKSGKPLCHNLHWAQFLDTHVSLAPTHVCPSVRWSVGNTFEFPFYQRLWLLFVKR